jgi:hypothetical protein
MLPLYAINARRVIPTAVAARTGTQYRNAFDFIEAPE